MAKTKPRSTLRRWLLVVAASAGLLFTTAAWTSRRVGELTTTVILVMAVVTVGSFPRTRRSSFRLGFVIAGWGWLAISLATPLGPNLPVTHWIDAARPPLSPAPNPNDWWETSEYRTRDRRDRDAYRFAGHSLFSLLLAVVGGAATRRILPVDDREPLDWRSPDGSLFQSGEGSSGPSPEADLV